MSDPRATSATSANSAAEGPVTAAQVATRAARGATAVLGRQGAVILANGIGLVWLARLLSPSQFALYAIASLATSVFAVIGDGGIGASLVQQSDPPTERQYGMVHTAQWGTGLTLGAVFFIGAGALSRLWGGPTGAVFVLRMAVVSVLIAAVQVVPTVRLERALRFPALGLVAALQAVVFNAVAVGLAAGGEQGRSLGYALVAEAVVGSIALFLTSPWRPGFTFPTRAELRPVVGFALPYQGLNLVSLAKDSVNPLFVGAVAGAAAVGRVSWAVQAAALPSIALMALGRLYLPVYSRLVGQPERLASAVEASVRACNALAVPFSVLLLILAGPTAHLIYGPKWDAAMPVFYLLWLANLIVPTTTPLFGLLSAVGRVQFAFVIAVVWMILTWSITGLLVPFIGIIGFGIANVVVQLTNAIVIISVKRFMDLRLLGSLWRSWSAGLVQALVVELVLHSVSVPGGAAVAASASAGLVVYALVVAGLERSQIQRFRLHLKGLG